uniref:CAAX prenyl protease n=1 Tax=Arcella intermedia TaxID=1963864 RepID=A0A6B2L4U8_9EUKA
MYLVFYVLSYVFETYLDWRQHKRFQIKKLPSELNNIANQNDFVSAQEYGADKSSFHLIENMFSTGVHIIVLIFNGGPWLWSQSAHILQYYHFSTQNETAQALVFVSLLIVITQLMNIPWSAYSTFVIEEKHHFNKTTPKTFVLDILKGLFLSYLIGLPFLALFIYIIQLGGPNFHIYLWAFTFTFQIFMITIYPVLIQPLFNKVEPLEECTLRSKIEAMAQKTGFPLTKIFKIDGSQRSSHSNAYFYGFGKNKRIVLYDTLIETLKEEEIIAVLGHELGHYFKNHIYKTLAITQIYLFVLFYLFGQTLQNNQLIESFGFKLENKSVFISFLVFSMLYSPVDHILSFLMTLLSRKHEFEADEFATKLGYGDQLRSGLISIHKENKANLWPDELYSTYHYSHPPLIERLKGIQRFQKQHKSQ